MRAIAELTHSLDASSFENHCLARHAQWLFGLGLELAWLKHPIAILALLLGKDLYVA